MGVIAPNYDNCTCSRILDIMASLHFQTKHIKHVGYLDHPLHAVRNTRQRPSRFVLHRKPRALEGPAGEGSLLLLLLLLLLVLLRRGGRRRIKSRKQLRKRGEEGGREKRRGKGEEMNEICGRRAEEKKARADQVGSRPGSFGSKAPNLATLFVPHLHD